MLSELYFRTGLFHWIFSGLRIRVWPFQLDPIRIEDWRQDLIRTEDSYWPFQLHSTLYHHLRKILQFKFRRLNLLLDQGVDTSSKR